MGFLLILTLKLGFLYSFKQKLAVSLTNTVYSFFYTMNKRKPSNVLCIVCSTIIVLWKLGCPKVQPGDKCVMWQGNKLCDDWFLLLIRGRRSWSNMNILYISPVSVIFLRSKTTEQKFTMRIEEVSHISDVLVQTVDRKYIKTDIHLNF